MWNSQHQLAEHYRLIIPELRGHGDSPLSTDISIRAFVTDILEVLDFLEIEKVHVCGLSLGGIVAQELYLRRPSLVNSLIICNSLSYAPFWLRGIVLYLGASSVMNRTNEENTKLFAAKCIYNQKDLALMRRAEETFFINKITYISSSKSSLSRNYLPFLPFFKIPVLVVGSDQDKVTPVYCAYQTHVLLPNSELFILRKCGHLSNIEKKEEFNNKVLSFLQNVRTA
ncbi:pimeloyl-ACP methyl ester carboxylesterase [Bacillus benzoevorans]|uniref:Pimeloyl-ACP methyl ester carboxylesterase n=1 Tax=Bacillus benzoevorans TaxID=1456 RepID=A0A7X0HQY9_9BACI|nr:pimeloyl-ACP methyl ester carboxylesterase [Bacillus benzoevorans]